jgi:hypothetical protein
MPPLPTNRPRARSRARSTPRPHRFSPVPARKSGEPGGTHLGEIPALVDRLVADATAAAAGEAAECAILRLSRVELLLAIDAAVAGSRLPVRAP